MGSRANHRFLLAFALLCAAVWLCPDAIVRAASAQSPGAAPSTAPSQNFPVASDARLAGDARQTRFILDLDKTFQFRAFTLADPYRVVLDIPQVNFQLPPEAGVTGRGLVKAFRYGLVMPGGSRIVFDLTGPAKIAKSYVLEAANGQPPRLVLELEQVDRTGFVQSLAVESRPELRPALADVKEAVVATPALSETRSIAAAPAAPDGRPVVVIDPGHGGADNGTQAGGESEKDLVLGFGLALRDRIEKNGKYRVVMTREDDTFIPLADRVKIARNQSAALFVSIHADALPRGEGDAQGATIYTLSDKASDAEAERLAEAENKADAIGGVNLTGRTDRGRRHPDRPGAARNPHLLEPVRPAADGRDEDDGADAQAPAEIGGFQGAEGARRAVGAGRTRLCLQQGRPASTWYRKTGAPGPSDRWRRRSTCSLPNGWRKPGRRTEKTEPRKLAGWKP